MTIQDLPAVNASLNALSTVLLIAGFLFIKAERKLQHIVCMVGALITSTLFLASYLTYHYVKAGHVTLFTTPGWPKTLYFIILGTHVPLAALTLPLVFMTIIPAFQARFDRHRRIARWTFPIWLYVSITGVLVYFMLYVWFPPLPAPAAVP